MQDRFYPSSADPTRSDRLRAALEYAARGWPVFPCRPGGKEPLTPRGHLDATTDPSRITAWFNRWPGANIGVPTGERSGVYALDVDDPAGLDAFEREHGRLPATRTHSTGSGGMHYLYRYPGDPGSGAGLRNTAGRLAPGIDTRGEGGYVIVPPSATTRPYEVLDDLPLAETPARVIEQLTRAQSAVSGDPGSGASKTTTTAVTTLDGPIPAGSRDDTLASIAGRLHDGTRDLDTLAAELLEVNAARCRPPLPDVQVEKIARSIHRRQPCSPGSGSVASPEVLEALEGVEARLWRLEWRGMGELSARDVYVALIKAGRSHGELIPSGVRVSISVRALALAAAVSKRTTHTAIKRLKTAGLIRSDNAERSGTRSGALVLLTPRANLHHSSTGGRGGSSGATLRAPRLRWSAPIIERVGDEVFRSTIRRLGKSCGAVIDALERAGGTATVGELADALHKSRPRDLRRRVVARLEAAGVVECSEDTVSLAPDWLDALNLERENAGEIDAHRRDMARYSREREAYASRSEATIRPEPGNLPEEPPAGEVRELERVEVVDPGLVEVLAAYLEHNPRRRDELPSWLSVAMWADGYTPARAPAPEIAAALAELRGRSAA